jgi:hypothetical protein
MKTFVAMLLPLALVACASQGRFESAGEDIDDAIEDARDDVEDAIDDARD